MGDVALDLRLTLLCKLSGYPWVPYEAELTRDFVHRFLGRGLEWGFMEMGELGAVWWIGLARGSRWRGR